MRSFDENLPTTADISFDGLIRRALTSDVCRIEPSRDVIERIYGRCAGPRTPAAPRVLIRAVRSALAFLIESVQVSALCTSGEACRGLNVFLNV
jgi:hypothetical protein